jgi:hypothetical protein
LYTSTNIDNCCKRKNNNDYRNNNNDIISSFGDSDTDSSTREIGNKLSTNSDIINKMIIDNTNNAIIDDKNSIANNSTVLNNGLNHPTNDRTIGNDCRHTKMRNGISTINGCTSKESIRTANIDNKIDLSNCHVENGIHTTIQDELRSDLNQGIVPSLAKVPSSPPSKKPTTPTTTVPTLSPTHPTTTVPTVSPTITPPPLSTSQTSSPGQNIYADQMNDMISIDSTQGGLLDSTSLKDPNSTNTRNDVPINGFEDNETKILERKLLYGNSSSDVNYNLLNKSGTDHIIKFNNSIDTIIPPVTTPTINKKKKKKRSNSNLGHNNTIPIPVTTPIDISNSDSVLSKSSSCTVSMNITLAPTVTVPVVPTPLSPTVHTTLSSPTVPTPLRGTIPTAPTPLSHTKNDPNPNPNVPTPLSPTKNGNTSNNDRNVSNHDIDTQRKTNRCTYDNIMLRKDTDSSVVSAITTPLMVCIHIYICMYVYKYIWCRY